MLPKEYPCIERNHDNHLQNFEHDESWKKWQLEGWHFEVMVDLYDKMLDKNREAKNQNLYKKNNNFLKSIW